MTVIIRNPNLRLAQEQEFNAAKEACKKNLNILYLEALFRKEFFGKFCTTCFYITPNYTKVSFFSKRAIIPQKSDRLWLLKRGVVKTLTWNETGKVIILGYWGQGEVVGSLLSKINPYEAECLSSVEAISIPWQNCHYLFKEISYCLQQTEELLRIIRTEKMYNRLVQLLVWLGQKFGSQVISGILINIRLTHQELADLIGATRVTVTRLLNQLEQEKIISRPQRFSIIIKDLNLLGN